MFMRYLIIIIFSILNIQFSTSQIYEVGIFAGGSNLIGDVGATNYILPNQMAFGGILKWNRSPRHSWRVSVIYSSFQALDRKSDDPRRIKRDYSYENKGVLELSAGLEFTFWEFNLHFEEQISTPYLYTGVTALNHNNYSFRNNSQFDEGTKSWAYGIPMVLGFKSTLTDQIIVALEVGVRYTFSDEIDGSVPDDPNNIETYGFGNLNNNDWYTFAGITLTYTFGRNSCYWRY